MRRKMEDSELIERLGFQLRLGGLIAVQAAPTPGPAAAATAFASSSVRGSLDSTESRKSETRANGVFLEGPKLFASRALLPLVRHAADDKGGSLGWLRAASARSRWSAVPDGAEERRVRFDQVSPVISDQGIERQAVQHPIRHDDQPGLALHPRNRAQQQGKQSLAAVLRLRSRLHTLQMLPDLALDPPLSSQGHED